MSDHENSRILVIDDEKEMLENCRRIFALWGHEVFTSADSTNVEDLIQEHRPDLIFSDLKMPDVDGIGVIERVQKTAPQIPVVIITGYATVESAVEAVKKGAFDYITKPFTMDLLKIVTTRALEKRELMRENELLRAQLSKGQGLCKIVGNSEAMREIFKLIERVAPLDANVIITGESGTGKELAARAIHSLSRRAERRFVPIDCASLPENLLESELFGHHKGAFTGAVAEKAGLLEFANHGTLFLDEVSELTPTIQSKLLRALQERTFRRVGGNEVIETDIRLIAATNIDLAIRVKDKKFREDLFYRLNVINIELPPLRKRRDDIPLIVGHFIERFGRNRLPAIVGITPEALAVLQAAEWPGNVRELENAIERAVALSEGEYLDVSDFPERISKGISPAPRDSSRESDGLLNVRKRIVRGYERDYVLRLLKQNAGNVSAAARQAGINRRTLYRLMQRYDVDPESLREDMPQ